MERKGCRSEWHKLETAGEFLTAFRFFYDKSARGKENFIEAEFFRSKNGQTCPKMVEWSKFWIW